MVDVMNVLVELASNRIDEYSAFFSKISDEELDAVLEFCKKHLYTHTWQKIVLDEHKTRIISNRNEKLDTLLYLCC